MTTLSNDSCGDVGKTIFLKNRVGFLSHPPRDRRGCLLGLRSLHEELRGRAAHAGTRRQGASHPRGQGKGGDSSWMQMSSPTLLWHPTALRSESQACPRLLQCDVRLCQRLFPLTSGRMRQIQTFVQDSQTCSSHAK